MPDVEVKGESAQHFLLVQGWEDAGRVTCRVRFLNSASQVNGAAAMATVSGLLRRTSLSGTVFNLMLQLQENVVCNVATMTFKPAGHVFALTGETENLLESRKF